MALVSSSVTPLEMRSMMVVGRLPVRDFGLAVTVVVAFGPMGGGTGGGAPLGGGLEAVEDGGAGGGSADQALAVVAASVAAANAKTRTVCILVSSNVSLIR